MSDPQQPQEPQPPRRPDKPERPDQSGLTSGDPLGGSSSSPAYPPGYDSPPPPGAYGGGPPAPTGPAPSPFAPGQYRLASWGRRAGALIVDGLIIFALAAVLLVPLGIGVFNSDRESGVVALIVAGIVTVVFIAVVALVYAPVMLTMTNGKTVGRMLFGTRVIRATGEKMTFGVAVVREVLLKFLAVGVLNALTAGLPWATLLDFLWPLWDDENRALHDFPTNTRTVLD